MMCFSDQFYLPNINFNTNIVIILKKKKIGQILLRYPRPPKIQSLQKMSHTLEVKNLAPSVRMGDIEEVFDEYGDIHDIRFKGSRVYVVSW